jgi:adenylate kinase family enzyme
MSADFGFDIVSTGDLLRSHIGRGTAQGRAVQSIIKQGGLVPNDIMLDILKLSQQLRRRR